MLELGDGDKGTPGAAAISSILVAGAFVRLALLAFGESKLIHPPHPSQSSALKIRRKRA